MALGQTRSRIPALVRISSFFFHLLFLSCNSSCLMPIEIYAPSCRNPSSCGSLSLSNCYSCYSAGGVVDPSFPTLCYCPATITYFSPSSTNVCSPTLSFCAGTYLCDPVASRVLDREKISVWPVLGLGRLWFTVDKTRLVPASLLVVLISIVTPSL